MPDFMNVPIPVEEPVIIVPIARPEEEQAAIEEYQVCCQGGNRALGNTY